MSDRLFTSKQAEDILSQIRLVTKFEISVLARIAFFLSISQNGSNIQNSNDFSGKEIRKSSFTGGDEIFIRTLISFVYGSSEINDENFYSNKSIIKNHIDDGCIILRNLFDQSEKNTYNFLKKIVEKIKFNFEISNIKTISINLGNHFFDNKEIDIDLNNTSKHANSHLAIMGKPGTGKTQFLLKILTDIRIQSEYKTNFIYFDYKGDVVNNEKFIEINKVKKYSLLDGKEYLPINPFLLKNYDEQSILISAREKAESFASINSKIGIVQKGFLTECILDGYKSRKKFDPPCPDFKDILRLALEKYESNEKNEDSLIEILKDLSSFNLFWQHGYYTEAFEKISNKTIIIDLHKMPVLKELVAYIVIERLYKEMLFLPEIPTESGRRFIQTILVLDEAHNYLPQKNIFLQKIIREGRSKGIFVFFASQSPNDYQQKFFNFQELLEFVFIFQCDGFTMSSVQEIIGCNNKIAKKLQSEISKLEPFQVITKRMDKDLEFTKFNSALFFNSY